MSLPSLLDPRAIRAAVVLFLVAFALVATVAMATAASSPKVLPVEPDGGIGTSGGGIVTVRRPASDFGSATNAPPVFFDAGSAPAR